MRNLHVKVAQLVLFAVLANPAIGQWKTVKAADPVKVPIPYTAQVNFCDINAHFNFDNLIGDELYFAKRSTLPNGQPDSVAAFHNLYSFNPTYIDTIFEPWQLSILTQKTPVNGWTFNNTTPVFPFSRTYVPGTAYKVYTYHPKISLDSRGRTIDIGTPYSQLENKHFKIIDCTDSSNNGMFCYLCFTLKDEEGSLLRWVVHSRDLWKYPAHFTSYLSWLKKEYLGKIYYAKQQWHAPDTLRNVLNNSYFPLLYGAKYTVTDVYFVDSKHSNCALPYLIFTDSAGTQYTVWEGKGKPRPLNVATLSHFTEEKQIKKTTVQITMLADSLENTYQQRTDSAAKANSIREQKLLKRFGKVNTQKILSSKVSIGMSAAMCKESWGEPFTATHSQNKNGLTEVWKYGVNRWLKFLNGILVAYSD